MNPTVSVVVPTYNRAALVPDAVKSILEGTYAPLEVIVADDGSTDETRRVIARMGGAVRYFYQENGGAAAARNLGISHTRGELVAFLDSDDVWVPQALDWLVERMTDDAAGHVDVVMGLTQRVHLGTMTPIQGRWAARTFGSALIRRVAFDRVGLLDETLRYGEDIDWFLRMREVGVPFAHVDRVTLLYRIHHASLMSDTTQAKLYTLKVIQKSLARRTNPETGHIRQLAEMPDLKELLEMVQSQPQ